MIKRRTTWAHRARCVLLSIVGLALLIGCGDDGGSGTKLELTPSLTIGVGENRPANVVLPADYDVEKRYPLVILLHGFGTTGAGQDFIFQLAEQTTPFQFILVLPDGTPNSRGERFWDAIPECCNLEGPPVDDVGYLAALMQEAMQIYAVDPHRIRLIGHSNGGFMAYRYICEHPVAVDRIVVLAGAPYLDASDCNDPKPVDLLHIHGTNDDSVLYNPNLPPDGNSGQGYTIGAEATVARWAEVAGCAEGLDLIARRDYHLRIRVGDDPAETEILRAPDCRKGNSVELWRSVNADHLHYSINDDWRDGVAAFLGE